MCLLVHFLTLNEVKPGSAHLIIELKQTSENCHSLIGPASSASFKSLIYHRQTTPFQVTENGFSYPHLSLCTPSPPTLDSKILDSSYTFFFAFCAGQSLASLQNSTNKILSLSDFAARKNRTSISSQSSEGIDCKLKQNPEPV